MSDAFSDRRLRLDQHGNLTLWGRLGGHALRTRGEAYLAVDCYEGRCSTNVRATTHQENGPGYDSVRGQGHGVCQCGEMSPHLPTGAARRRWSRAHKARALLGQPEPPGQPAPVDPRAVA